MVFDTLREREIDTKLIRGDSEGGDDWVLTDARNRLLNYKRDISVPKQRIRWNWIVDLPFGKGKWLGHNSGKALDKVIGGWQLAGSGTVRSNYFTMPTDVYSTGAPIEVYGKKYPIEDCRSGTCFPGYLWWNGYIPANQINSHDAQGRPNGVMGVPANYKPAAAPLIAPPVVMIVEAARRGPCFAERRGEVIMRDQ